MSPSATAKTDAIVRGRAAGWIAIGDHAIGVLFATGGSAVGGIAVGGAFLRVVCIRRTGGRADHVLWTRPRRIWSFSGFAIGWKAFGGVAIGAAGVRRPGAGRKSGVWRGSLHIGWWARQRCIAESTIGPDRFFQIAYWLSFHPYALVLATLILSFLPWIAIWSVQKSGPRPDAPTTAVRHENSGGNFGIPFGASARSSIGIRYRQSHEATHTIAAVLIWLGSLAAAFWFGQRQGRRLGRGRRKYGRHAWRLVRARQTATSHVRPARRAIRGTAEWRPPPRPTNRFSRRRRRSFARAE